MAVDETHRNTILSRAFAQHRSKRTATERRIQHDHAPRSLFVGRHILSAFIIRVRVQLAVHHTGSDQYWARRVVQYLLANTA
jgi:hypothetical protein